jgi:hypothetical protein
MAVDSEHYTIPPKSWITHGGGSARSRHGKSSHAWHKRQAAKRSRRVGKQIVHESLND